MDVGDGGLDVGRGGAGGAAGVGCEVGALLEGLAVVVGDGGVGVVDCGGHCLIVCNFYCWFYIDSVLFIGFGSLIFL